MIYCQSCLTPNLDEGEYCRKCGLPLLVLVGNQRWEEPEVQRISIEDHFLERISRLEETVQQLLDHIGRLTDTIETMERNAFVSRSGLTALMETLRESNLLREELLHERWEATMTEQMEVARYRDRFTQMRDRFLALYRGDPKKKSSFQSMVEEAEFLMFSNRFFDSAEVLTEALQLDDLNYELAYYLGEYFQEQGMLEEAKDFLRVALAANPDHLDSQLVLALLCYAGNELAESETLLTRVLERNPHHGVGLISMGAILIGSDRHKEARPLLQTALRQDPQPQCYYLLGLVAKEEGRPNVAIRLFKTCLEMDPEHEEALFHLGMTCLERGWTRKAQEVFSRALELNPNNLQYQEAAGAASGLPEDTQTRQEMDEQSVEELDLARSLLQDGQYKQALSRFRQLVRRYPANPSAVIGCAAAQFSLRRFEDAVRLARKALSLELPQPLELLARTLEMECLRATGNHDDAIVSLEDMAEKFPTGAGKAIAGYGLAMTKADLGEDLVEAEELAGEALASSPPEFRHNALDALGWVYFKQGRLEEALELVESALSMRETVNHLYHYGMILLALNLKEQAFEVFERTEKLRSRDTALDDYLLNSIHADIQTGAPAVEETVNAEGEKQDD